MAGNDNEAIAEARRLRRQGVQPRKIASILNADTRTVKAWTDADYAAFMNRMKPKAIGLASQGIGATNVARRLGITKEQVGKLAGNKIAAYKKQLKLDVIAMVKAGRSPQSIADAKNIDIHTVRSWAKKELEAAEKRRRQGGR